MTRSPHRCILEEHTPGDDDERAQAARDSEDARQDLLIERDEDTRDGVDDWDGMPGVPVEFWW